MKCFHRSSTTDRAPFFIGRRQPIARCIADSGGQVMKPLAGHPSDAQRSLTACVDQAVDQA